MRGKVGEFVVFEHCDNKKPVGERHLVLESRAEQYSVLEGNFELRAAHNPVEVFGEFLETIERLGLFIVVGVFNGDFRDVFKRSKDPRRQLKYVLFEVTDLDLILAAVH